MLEGNSAELSLNTEVDSDTSIRSEGTKHFSATVTDDAGGLSTSSCFPQRGYDTLEYVIRHCIVTAADLCRRIYVQV